MIEMSERDDRPASTATDLTLTEMMLILARDRRRLMMWAFVPALLVLLWLLVVPRTYTAHAQLTPVAGQQSAGRLTSLAAQFGVAGIMPDGGESPDYLVDVVTSHEMLASLVDGEYTAELPGRLPFGLSKPTRVSGTLVRFYDLDTVPELQEKSREKAIRKLRKDLSASARLESGVVSISVRMQSRELADQVLRRLLANLERYNRERRQSRASAERRFVEDRLETAKQELLDAENRLARFLEQNRSFEGSPSLRFQYERLSREASLRHDVLRTLSQAYEQARIEEVRSTPVYTIVSSPHAPAIPDRRYGLVKLMGAMVVGLGLGVFMSFMTTLVAKERQENPRLAADWQEVRGTLLRELWPIRRNDGRQVSAS